MDVTLIAAMDRNRVIGRASGEIPWKLPDDVAHFKRDTLGKPIVQGRKTYDTVGKPLPNRHNIVLSRSASSIPGCTVVRTADEALRAAGEVPEVMIIGGGEIYAMFLPLATKMTLTHVDAEVAGEAHFPAWDRDAWREVSREHHPIDDRHAHAFDVVRYVRARQT
jgi:dihydrofolate reductase